MGLLVNSGPSWDEDFLNEIDIESVAKNASEMLNRRRFWKSNKNIDKLTYFPNITSE